jgi:esterase/lipase
MTAFVLVHGAWGGAHGSRHVRRLLRSAQHDVSTPSLTGVGERIHLTSPLVGLGTHIRDVVNHVLYEDLQEIVLVGFSYHTAASSSQARWSSASQVGPTSTMAGW